MKRKQWMPVALLVVASGALAGGPPPAYTGTDRPPARGGEIPKDPLENYYGNTMLCGAPITGEDACHMWMERGGVLKGGSAVMGKTDGHYTVSQVYPDGHVQVCIGAGEARPGHGPSVPAGVEIPKSARWDPNDGLIADCHTKNMVTKCIYRDPKTLTPDQIKQTRERRTKEGVCYPYWNEPVNSMWMELDDPLPTQGGIDKMWIIKGHM